MKNLTFLIACFPFMLTAQDAKHDPWGISHMQYGVKTSWYKVRGNENGNFDQSNYSFGPTGRIQASLLDLTVYGEEQQRFRLVDVIGFEAGTGFQKSITWRNDQEYYGKFVSKRMWYDVGIDLGILLKVRIIPKLDLGVKYMYLSQVNSTFNFPGAHSAYGNALNWSFSARYGRFYADLNLIKGQKAVPKTINVLDVKYRFEDEGAWASYVGIQIGAGVTKKSSQTPDLVPTYSRNWIQVSIGKMTNF